MVKSGRSGKTVSKSFMSLFRRQKGAKMVRYRRLPLDVDAAEITADCIFKLPCKSGVINARAGDWLVRQPDGGLGVVAQEVFEETYILVPESL